MKREIFGFIALFGVVVAEGAVPGGLVGGGSAGDVVPAYAALLTPGDTLTPLSGDNFPSTDGLINAVAINNSGAGIIGGRDRSSNPAYAALVSPNGTLTQLSDSNFPSTSGTINGVAINSSGTGLIGGQNLSNNHAYAALVSPTGALTNLSNGDFPSTNGAISSTAINSSGNGVIGGVNNSSRGGYAALVAPDGTLTTLVDSSLTSRGNITSVAINESGAGLIGGSVTATPSAYAAVFSPNNPTLTELSGGGLPAHGGINSVAINNSGAGLIGGQDTASNAAYAALVSPNSTTLTQLSGGGLPSINGVINSVAINQSGVGLIGGKNNDSGAAYAAFVSPGGALTQLGNLPTTGTILSVAINRAGVALIGGEDLATNGAFAALVAPNGTVTPLSGSDFPQDGKIASVAINDAVVPTFIGPYASTFNIVLAQMGALQSHLNQEKQSWDIYSKPQEQEEVQEESQEENQEVGLLASANWMPEPACRPNTKQCSLWLAPFGDLIKQSAQGSIPSYTNEIAGALLGLDCRFERGLIGGGLAYAFDYSHFSEQSGHAKINEEAAVLYGAFRGKNVFFDLAVWGGIYQLYNERHTVFTSTANSDGWLLSPHAELSYLARWECFTLEPFVMADWANSWQRHYTEKNAQGFALVVPSQYGSLLRSEAGLRFYETWCFNWGRIFLEEKGSYVNRTPFSVSPLNTFFIGGAASSFSVTTGSSHTQNLGGVELRCSFVPWSGSKAPYGSIDFQGEFGSSFQSYFASIEIGKNF